MITLIKYDQAADMTDYTFSIWTHDPDCKPTFASGCVGHGNSPREALTAAHQRLTAELDRINELCGYSDELLAKELKE